MSPQSPTSMPGSAEKERLQALLQDAETKEQIDEQINFLKQIIDENIGVHEMIR